MSPSSIAGMVRGGGVAVTVTAVLLVVAACGGGDLRQVSAASSDVVGSWRGSDGTQVNFRADGTFDADHWPDLSGAKVTYGRDSGKWEILHQDGIKYNSVQLTHPGQSGDHDLPGEIAVVQQNGKPGVCVDRDPDDICASGVLTRS